MEIYHARIMFVVCVCVLTYSVHAYAITGAAADGAVRKYSYNITCPPPVCPAPIVNLVCPDAVACPVCQEVPPFVIHAGMVAGANGYDRGLYDCTQYSKELFRRLENDGYKPQFCIGYLDGDKHDWIKMGRRTAIEATTGWFVPPHYYEEHYREIGCWSHIPVGA